MNDKYINQCNVRNCWYMKHVYIFYCKLINVSFLVETKKGTTSEKESKKQDFDPFSLDPYPPTINRDIFIKDIFCFIFPPTLLIKIGTFLEKQFAFQAHFQLL